LTLSRCIFNWWKSFYREISTDFTEHFSISWNRFTDNFQAILPKFFNPPNKFIDAAPEHFSIGWNQFTHKFQPILPRNFNPPNRFIDAAPEHFSIGWNQFTDNLQPILPRNFNPPNRFIAPTAENAPGSTDFTGHRVLQYSTGQTDFLVLLHPQQYNIQPTEPICNPAQNAAVGGRHQLIGQ
jgi:hypothetical protein